jgi:hypothetical protein
MILRMEARMSSIEGSCAFAGWVIVLSPRDHVTPNRVTDSESIAPRDGKSRGSMAGQYPNARFCGSETTGARAQALAFVGCAKSPGTVQ